MTDKKLYTKDNRKNQTSIQDNDSIVISKSTFRFIVVFSVVLVLVTTILSDTVLNYKLDFTFINNNNNNNDNTAMYSLRQQKYPNITTITSTTNSILDQLQLDDETIEHHKGIVQCSIEYNMIKKQNQMNDGIGDTEYSNSRAHHGNIRRLSIFIEKLQAQTTPVTVVSHGGSISLGHGIHPWDGIYSNTFVNFLNNQYPIINSPTNGEHSQQQQQQQHTLINHARHGADICYVAKYFNFLKVPDDTDLFLLEFAVNDYEGQDDLLWVDAKTDMFFDGFERLTYCAEAVVRKIIKEYPNAAIVFIEFRSAIMTRKTAQLFHTGVAQHYQIPIVSYADAIFPKFWNLLRQLNKTNSFSIPDDNSPITTNTIQPYPFGCHECRTDHMTDQFKDGGCHNVCFFWEETLVPNTYHTCKASDMPIGQKPCYSAFFAHDEVHPSWYGHQVARDLLIELVAVTTQEICIEKNRLSQIQQTKDNNNNNNTNANDIVPSYLQQNYVVEKFGVYASEDMLAKETEYILVQTTSDYLPMDVLNAVGASNGFTSSNGGHGVIGWYSSSPDAGEFVEFVINLPTIDSNSGTPMCYVVYIASIKSYESMGDYTIEMTDGNTQQVTTVNVVGVWKPRISIPFDTQINTDTDKNACTGYCKIKIISHNEIPERNGNQIKITDLSVRPCHDSTTNSNNNNSNDNPDDPAGPWIAL